MLQQSALARETTAVHIAGPRAAILPRPGAARPTLRPQQLPLGQGLVPGGDEACRKHGFFLVRNPQREPLPNRRRTLLLHE